MNLNKLQIPGVDDGLGMWRQAQSAHACGVHASSCTAMTRICNADLNAGTPAS